MIDSNCSCATRRRCPSSGTPCGWYARIGRRSIGAGLRGPLQLATPACLHPADRQETADARRPTVALNRKARHEFTIDEMFEAGSCRPARRSSRSARARQHRQCLRARRARRGVAHRRGHRAVRAGNRYNHDPKRTRKLLLHGARSMSCWAGPKAKGQTDRPASPVPQPGQGQDRTRSGPRQAAPRPSSRYRRSRRPSAISRPAGRRAPRSLTQGGPCPAPPPPSRRPVKPPSLLVGPSPAAWSWGAALQPTSRRADAPDGSAARGEMPPGAAAP